EHSHHNALTQQRDDPCNGLISVSLEKLHNLEVLPPHGFYISCFPHKIRGASAGWTRAVAIFDDALNAG
ncbi:hypothetical protein M0F01_24970, partial [Ralstonia solanacearum]|nr:hypothetical protein [Ralstonia solanacearum]